MAEQKPNFKPGDKVMVGTRGNRHRRQVVALTDNGVYTEFPRPFEGGRCHGGYEYWTYDQVKPTS